MSSCQQCITRQLSMLNALSTSELKCISENKSARVFKKGEVLFSEGELLKGIFCIEEGKCKLSKLSDNGKDQIVKFHKQGEVLGYRSVINREPTNLSAIAIEEMRACFIPKEYLLEYTKTNHQFSDELFKTLCDDLKGANKATADMAQKTVKQRLADALLFLEDTFGTVDNCIDIELTREEIANIIGTATESAIRLLSELKKDSVITFEGKRIQLLDKAKLSRISKGF